MLQEYQLDGKVALVTGAGRGIGAACAEALAQAGAAVMITDIDLEACQALVTRLREQGCHADCMQQDVVDEATWEEVVSQTIDRLGGFDVLVNNAGILTGALVETDTLEQVRRINSVNIDSIFLGMKYAARAMKPDGPAGRGGSIINMSSVAGLFGTLAHSAYGSTKGAVRSYSKHAAAEFGSLGYAIRVNSVHPGLIETPMGDHLLETWIDLGIVPDEAAARETIHSMTSVGRLGTPREVALAVVFLASDASSYVTGSELVVDGGMSGR
ncbi:dehydrogenase [Oceanococcus atlanticus]|uniref:Dehydrogenase n=1 Tax=Oceanococcus atlanticus TaxID=1317117 RepID=A0A1Y1SE53_9GAMM|nr:glucose 1-dehydrogenase [Oceanococcus atlanticus]ORE87270.1 dehydrogenase [Oceanococcus atlanticus]